MKMINLVTEEAIVFELNREELIYQLNMFAVLEDTLNNPIEIWERDNKRYFFTKYESGSYMVVTDGEDIKGFFEITDEEANQNRYGVLIYAKTD